MPAPAAAINGPVRRLTAEEVCDFHRPLDSAGDSDGQARLCLHYASLLMRQGDPLIAPLLLNILDRLGHLFPAEQARLKVMRNSVAWRSIVQPAG